MQPPIYVMRESKTEPIWRNDTYEITNQKLPKWKEWLRPKLLWLMEKLGVIQKAMYQEVISRRIQIDTDRIYKAIDQKIMDEMYMRMYHRKDITLVIGYDMFGILLDEEYTERLNFIMPVRLGGSHGYQYKDIPVYLEPTIDGVFLLKGKVI